MTDKQYKIKIRDAEWDVYEGTHVLAYTCDHGGLTIVAWADWSPPEEIPLVPICENVVHACGEMLLIGGCHTVHKHELSSTT